MTDQDWNSGGGAFPTDRNEYTLYMTSVGTNVCIVRHLSDTLTLPEVASLCRDELGDVDRVVTVAWSLRDPSGDEIACGCVALRPTGETP